MTWQNNKTHNPRKKRLYASLSFLHYSSLSFLQLLLQLYQSLYEIHVKFERYELIFFVLALAIFLSQI